MNTLKTAQTIEVTKGTKVFNKVHLSSGYATKYIRQARSEGFKVKTEVQDNKVVAFVE